MASPTGDLFQPAPGEIKLPALYDAARRALAACVRVDEVKDIRDRALAMEVYAYQSKDAELAGWSAELRVRSTHRLGVIIKEDAEAGRLAKPVPGPGRGKVGLPANPTFQNAPTLADQGVDKNLAHRARTLAAMPPDEVEAEVAKSITIAVAAVKGTKAVIAAARAESHRQKRETREKRERALASKIIELPDRRDRADLR